MEYLKNVLIYLAICMVIYAVLGCGGKATPQVNPLTCSDFTHEYYNIASHPQRLYVTDNCQFTDNVCNYSGSFTVPDQYLGEYSSTISITASNNAPGCLVTGSETTCELKLDEGYLFLDCGSGLLKYNIIEEMP